MSKVKNFLSYYLGEEALETIAKNELYKEATGTALDFNEIHTATQIVPKTVLVLLHKELGGMKSGENKEFPFSDGSDKKATIHAQKHSSDNYSGYISREGKILARFKNRSLPGVGIILLSTFELYDFQSNQVIEKEDPKKPSIENDINKIIDERLNLLSMVRQVVDQKISEREAINKMINDKIFSMLKEVSKEEKKEEKREEKKEEEKPTPIKKNEDKIGSKLKAFLDKKKPHGGIKIILSKSENVISCPDCGQKIFKNDQLTGCLCCGESKDAKIFIKKSEDGFRVRFSKDWTRENIALLLETIRNRK